MVFYNDRKQPGGPGSGNATTAANSSSRQSGTGSSVPPVISYHLSAQHERLMLELLPFKEGGQFREWLTFLQGDWHEFCRDYFLVDSNASLPEPEKASTAQQAKDAISSKTLKYLVYHPDKTGWTGQDHSVRFIATATADSILRGTWSESDWRRRSLEITRAVYEVLSFLRASELASMQQQQTVPPPGYDVQG